MTGIQNQKLNKILEKYQLKYSINIKNIKGVIHIYLKNREDGENKYMRINQNGKVFSK